MHYLQAVLLGLIEGLTEFIPVSSTGHLLLAQWLMGFESKGRTFEVLIQLGAILALVTVYFGRLWYMVKMLPFDQRIQRFLIGVVLAFIPAALVGVLAHKFIKEFLFESPLIICISLLVGGIIIIVVERMRLQPKVLDAGDIGPVLAFKIGLCQCLALVPGVSRSGATIVGGLLLGVEKRAATEFSFFLAMPTMAGAFTYDLYKNWSVLAVDDVVTISIGFVSAFIAGVIIVRYVLDFITSRGLAPFGWWRILVGSAGLAILAFGG